jgi:hypothetical protein
LTPLNPFHRHFPRSYISLALMACDIVRSTPLKTQNAKTYIESLNPDGERLHPNSTTCVVFAPQTRRACMHTCIMHPTPGYTHSSGLPSLYDLAVPFVGIRYEPIK